MTKSRFLLICAAAGLMGAPALAQDASGDAAAGEKAFGACQACHVVVNADGETLAGKRAKTGPNLYGIIGEPAGDVEGFRFSKSMKEAGEKGLTWDEKSFVAYVQDPTGFLRDYLDDKHARAKMAFKVRNEEDAVNLYAFLVSLSPAEADAPTN